MSEQELLEFRRRKNVFFASSQSPLPQDMQRDFRALNYFDFASNYQFEPELLKASTFEHVMMDTSAGVRKSFVRTGRLEFELKGQLFNLTAFSNPELDDGGLFIPFRDATSGVQTYGGGRYLDCKLEPDGRVKLDFNTAYNPYCAYSDGWTCPLPPQENWLNVAILAGEKVHGLK
jgi:uncharacterized protein